MGFMPNNETERRYFESALAMFRALSQHLQEGRTPGFGSERQLQPYVATAERPVATAQSGRLVSAAGFGAQPDAPQPPARTPDVNRPNDRTPEVATARAGADANHPRTTSRSNENYDYNTERTALLQNLRDGQGRPIGREQLRAIEARMGPNGEPPLSQAEAARMFHDLNHLLTRTEGQLSSTMGPEGTRRDQARAHAVEFLQNVGHCQGTDTSIFQNIGSCGIMGTYGDLCRAAPSNASQVLVAGMEAQNGTARLANGTRFGVHESFMQGQTAQEMFHGMATNMMLNPQGQYYTFGAARGQGDSGHRIHQGSFTGAVLNDPHTGRPYDSPNTTPRNIEALDRLLGAGTVRLWDSSVVSPEARALGGPGSSMIDIAGMNATQRREAYMTALNRGGGTCQILGDANLFLGLRGGGDAYHNTSLSITRAGNFVITDTNRGFSNDHANLGIVDAGITMHRNRESDSNIQEQSRLHPERNRPRPDGGMNGLDSDAADRRRRDPNFAKKDDDDDARSRSRRQQQAQAEMERQQQRAMAQQQLDSIRLRQVAYQLSNPGKDLPPELQTPGNLVALASTSVA